MRTFGALVVLLLVGGCAAGTPAADSPEDEAKATAEADSKEAGSEDTAAESGSDETAESGGEGEGEGEAEKDSEPKAEAQRLLTEEGTAFLYDFSKSDAGEKAKERCEKSSGGNAEKNASCMSKATKAVKPQGFKFERDKETEDGWLFVRFEIRGTRPVEINRVKAEFADDTGKKITIKTQGPDKARGGKPVPATFEIELPDQYTLIIDEPGRGKSVYEPKLGLFDAQ
ncbi:MAG TPA: hypothetical protein VFU02_13250 [Polyangiaceae bacterium]|nr:hypothetical protein [Polyangiaceae bacterium]